MKAFFAVLLAIVCTAFVLFGVGIVVCILGLMTEGNWLVLLAGAGVGIPFAFYSGYRVARAVLWSPPDGLIRPPPPAPRNPPERP
jgi:hypothetical protein